MYYTDKWRILVPEKRLRTFLPSETKFILGKLIKHSFLLDKYIENIWKEETQRAKQNKSLLINGDLIKFDSFQLVDDKLVIKVNLTNYKEYKATAIEKNKIKFKEKYGRSIATEECARSFASETVPITKDNYIVLLKRSNIVDEFEGLLSLPSGGKWDGDPIGTYHAMLRSSEELFERCKKIVKNEFSNEVNVKEDTQKLLGLSETIDYSDHALLFMVQLDADHSMIIKNKDKILAGNKKYVDLKLVKFEKLAFTNFLNHNVKKIAFWVYPALIMVGAHRFGEDWPLSIKGVRKIE